jgi:hypothetical protein
MKITYEAASDRSPWPKYYLYATSTEEMKFFTILRDMLEDKNKHIRFIGAEALGHEQPGCPQKPVQSIGLAIQDNKPTAEVEKDASDPGAYTVEADHRVRVRQRKAFINRAQGK